MSLRNEFKRALVGATPSALRRLDRVSKLRTVHLPPSDPRIEHLTPDPYTPLVEKESRPIGYAPRPIGAVDLDAYTRGYEMGRSMYLALKRGEGTVLRSGYGPGSWFYFGYSDGIRGLAYKASL